MGAAAAVVLMKERHIVDAFADAGATSPDTARYPSDVGADEGGIGWRRLRSRAVVRESAPGSGRYFVDIEVWQAVRRTRRRMIAMMLLLVAAAVVVGVFSTRQAM